MYNFNVRYIIKKTRKIALRWLGYILLVLLLLFILLSIPVVQTKLGKTVTERINKKYGTHIVVQKMDLSFLGSVQLKGIQIKDHHKDTLIFVNNLTTSLVNAKRIIDNQIDLGSVSLSGVHFYMKTYKGESDDNMAVFLSKFDNNEPKDSLSNPFVLKTENIYVEDLTFRLVDENKDDYLMFSAENAGGTIQDFKVEGPNIYTKVRNLYFTENRGVRITNLSSDFSYTKKQMLFKNTTLETNNKSSLVGNISFNYKREDFKYFTDKVLIKANFKNSNVSVKDLKKIYNELSGNDVVSFSGKIVGTLNNFSVDNLVMRSKKGMRFKGDMAFLNSFKPQRGFVFETHMNYIKSNYNQLKGILPNVLGKTMPTEFKKLGNFTITGLIKVTPEQMDATLTVNSEIGGTISDLQLTNIDDIDNAEYNGEVEFVDLDLAVLLGDELLGKTSLKADVQGSGFTAENLNTSLIGEISKIDFKGYTYQNLNINGQIENKKFDGFLQANDDNFKLKFEGLADFSSAVNKFDFTADIDKADLKKTNLFTRDSTAILSGKIKLDLSGNTFDDIVGKATFENISYTNQKQEYKFSRFDINSSIKDSIQTIKVNSKDIIDGKLTGKFTFAELLPMTQNALGSVYTNYNPYPVKPKQFIDFDFKIYNQIVDVFLPKVSVGKNTRIRGKIKSDNNFLRLTFSSPKIDAYGNVIDKALLRMDNKNPLYNTHLTADNISTKYYNIHKLNLLNRTKNDTLFFKSIFKGGKNKSEKFNLDFFYTINKDRKSVVGVQKSTFNYKNFDWVINPKEDKNNKVTFDLNNKSFNFNPFTLISNEQKIEFKGSLLGDNNKDLQAKFTKVKLASFLPSIDSLALKGELNGTIDFTQKQEVYSPKGSLVINNLYINNNLQGNLAMQVTGKDSYEKLDVNLSLENEKAKKIVATGGLDFSKERPEVNISVSLKEYQLAAFSPLGGGVLSKLRGSATGNFTAKGYLRNPNFDGTLSINDAGLTFPYLNVDFDLKGNTNLKLKNQSFILTDVVLEDTKAQTQGTLNGSITHQNFEQWFLNLDINTKNLLVLDTQEQEEVPYYGTAFLDGTAKIRGLTSNLTIDVVGKTNPNTLFVIPLSDVKTIDSYKLIHFRSKKKEKKQVNLKDIKGLNLNINLDVTKDAVAQVVIDKVSGSELKGSGKGNLQIEIDTRGKFNMFGDFEVDSGVYNFKYFGINKPFTVQKGGTISWNGNPFEAELNITAIYRTKANPSQLLENIQTSRSIPIDLYTKITGGLFSSKQEFDIKIPNANSSVTSELEFVLNDNNKSAKIIQFASLLATNSFLNENSLGNNVTSSITGTASDILGGVLSSIINSKDGKFQLGLGYTQGNEADINTVGTDSQVDLSVSTQINDRVIVNGKVGIPVGANTQTSVAGDVKVEVLLNEKGNLRGTVFNKQNEVQYSALEEEGYTQGIGLSYQVNFNNGKELLEKIGLRKKKKDSTLVKKNTFKNTKKELINFGRRTKKEN